MSDVAMSSNAVSAYMREQPVMDTATRRKRLRARLFLAAGGILAAVAAGAGAWWLIEGQRFISTDDAYVAADSAAITPQVDGTISAVPVTETTRVKRGQVLVQLDPADTELAYAQAQANYAEAVRHVHQYVANTAEAEAQVAARKADLDKASEDYRRRVALAAAQAISAEQLGDARSAYDAARANVAAAQQTLESDRALIGGVDVDHNPEVLAAKAAMDKAKLDLSRSVIRAPFDGVVAQKSAQVGQRVAVGQALMSVVPVKDAYVEANFKEGQLTKVHAGQQVTLTSDLYGSRVVFHGRVEGLSGGTGSAFSVIPAQNATGNWIKVVQRLPVRVALDPRELAEHPLRVGLSMDATIDVAP